MTWIISLLPFSPRRILRASSTRVGRSDGWLASYLHPCGGSEAPHQVIEFSFYLGLEVGFDLVDLGKLGKGPAAIGSQIVHARHPVSLHGGPFLFGILAPVALDLDDQVQQVAFP